LCSFRSAATRDLPPEVVSPLMLAFTTRQASFSATSRFSSKATQPLPRANPYSADRLSPSTSKTGFAPCAWAGEAAARQAAAASALQCRSQARRATQEERMSEALIEVKGVTKQVTDATGTLTILHEINFVLGARETVAIVGASGSGKSTLLSILAGLDTPSSGTVVLAGADLFSLSEDARAEVRSRQVGFVFQSFQLLGNLTALENVMLPLELKGRSDARAAATDMLKRVGLGERLGHYPKVLSGGEQQRVALARAFVMRPAVLLADEPTGSLDFATGATVMDLMFELNREAGTTLVLVTHDQAIAARCDRQLRMEAGRLNEA
jgi:putative ABC transport system ATP-binding protein